MNVPVLHGIGAEQARTIVRKKLPAQSELTTTIQENDNINTSLPSSAGKKYQSCEISNK